jgi:hypothetical protein
MKEPRNDLLKGTLDLLVLQSLSLGPLHGLGVSDRISQITKGAFNVKTGSLPCTGSKKQAGSNHPGASQTTIAAQDTIGSPKPDNANSKSKPKAGNASPSPSPPHSKRHRS